MFLSLLSFSGSWRGGGFLSTSQLCRPTPQHQHPTHIPENDCHIIRSQCPPCVGPDSHISCFPLSLVFRRVGFLSQLFPHPTKSFLLIQLCIPLFSPCSIVFIKLYLGFHLFWRGWTLGPSIIKARRRKVAALVEAGIHLLQTPARLSFQQLSQPQPRLDLSS